MSGNAAAKRGNNPGSLGPLPSDSASLTSMSETLDLSPLGDFGFDTCNACGHREPEPISRDVCPACFMVRCKPCATLVPHECVPLGKDWKVIKNPDRKPPPSDLDPSGDSGPALAH